MVDKDVAAADWDQLFAWSIRTITGLFTLAGRPELAAKVLSTITRRGQREVVEDPADTGGGETDDSEPPTGEECETPPAGPESEPPPSDSTPFDPAA